MKPMTLFDESWFYAPDADAEALRDSRAIALPEDEAHHAFHVLRLREGQHVLISNGIGDVYESILTGSGKAGLVQPIRQHIGPSDTPKAALAVALLKGKDSEDPVAACCQLPISDVFLLRTDHTQVFSGQDHDKLVQRLRHKSVVALKQARKSHLTRIHAPMELTQWRKAHPESILVYAHPGADTLPHRPDRDFTLCIGPEGGFSAAELAWFAQESACYRLGLGETRLRAEQAPLVGLGKLLGLGWL